MRVARDATRPRWSVHGIEYVNSVTHSVKLNTPQHVERRGPKWKKFHSAVMQRRSSAAPNNGVPRGSTSLPEHEALVSDEPRSDARVSERNGEWPWPELASTATVSGSNLPPQSDVASATTIEPISLQSDWMIEPLASSDSAITDAPWDSIWSNLGLDPSTFLPVPPLVTQLHIDGRWQGQDRKSLLTDVCPPLPGQSS